MARGPSMYESLKQGKPVDVEELETLADCLGGSIGLNNKYTFKIAKKVFTRPTSSLHKLLAHILGILWNLQMK